MTERLIKTPKNRFEMIMMLAVVAEVIAEEKITQERIFNQLNKEGIELTEEQIEQVKSSFE